MMHLITALKYKALHVALHDPNKLFYMIFFIQDDYDEDELIFDLIAVDITTIN